ncbi:exopolyphosphatase [Anaerolentibacter hominis]|uniref:Ppx/GppA phosphatase family protein n=1 Tax=Anaerolentibacter hominis TaxID=3079009 RepID=UPI0031B808DB
MAYITFAAIDVGSDALNMKIFEISGKAVIKELDQIRHEIPLGAETYIHGKISRNTIDEMCEVLSGFTLKMQEYGVSAYTAYATSAIREASNNIMLLEQVKLRTGLKVKIVSNSEQRFLSYKAIALGDEFFQRAIKKGTAIVDVSAGSIQISLMDKEALILTQNIKVGSLRMREVLASLEPQTADFTNLISEYLNNDLTTFRSLFLKDTRIKNMIAHCDYLYNLKNFLPRGGEQSYLEKEEFLDICSRLLKMSPNQLAQLIKIPREQATLLLPTLTIYYKLFEYMDAERIWFSSVTLCDGIAIEYAEKKEKAVLARDFTADILAATRNIARRYECNRRHTDQVEYIALRIFDVVGKRFGLNKRDRLLLQIAVILHNCGEFINMNKVPQNSYNIIMSTEIIGLSHQERELCANIVRYDADNFPKYTAIIDGLDRETYMKVAQLTAILRLANILDKSHLQKFPEVKVSLKGDRLQILVTTFQDITLEKGLFKPKGDFFEEVYGLRPVLKEKRRV